MGYVETLTELGWTLYEKGARRNDIVFISHDTGPYIVDSP